MSCTRINKLRESKLLNSTQTLKFPGIHELPKKLFKFTAVKFYKVMQRVAYALRFDHKNTC